MNAEDGVRVLRRGPSRRAGRARAALRTLSHQVVQALALAGAARGGIPVTMIDRRNVTTVRQQGRQLVREIDAYLSSRTE
jgi:hypothetical protein